MKLSKTIPSRVKTVEFLWCRKDWMQMDQEYRDARKELKLSKEDSCYWCNHEFKDAEMISLAYQKEKNVVKVLCQKCANELTQPEQRRDKR